MIIIENSFLNKLVNHLKKHTIEEYILCSLDKWIDYINVLGLMDEYITEYIMDKSNKDSIEEFINEDGILNLQYTEDRILKRYIIGFDYDISIRVKKDFTFREYFEAYGEYLEKHPLNNSLKLKLVLSVISRKVNTVPKLATFDTVENDWDRVGYNIYYSTDVSESLAINIRQDLSKSLAVISDDRNSEKLDIIEKEMLDLFDLISQGLFKLIINNNYPNNLESILPEKVYIEQIEDRILKDEVAVKYIGKLYRSIKLGSSYVVVDDNLHAIEDGKVAEAIYCKINLSKSMFC